MGQLRIVYLNPGGSLGGAERALLDLMQAVRQARPQWTLELVMGGGGDLASLAQRMGVNAEILPFPPSFSRLGDAGAGGPAGNGVSKPAMLGSLSLSAPRIAAYAWKLRSVLAGHEPDLIHSNGFKTHILAAWARPPRAKVIWHVHDYVGARPLMSRLMRIHVGRCALAVTNSRSVAMDFEHVCGNGFPVRPLHNAVDLEHFSPQGPVLDLDAAAGLPSAPAGCVRVGLVATMARWKGHEVFLRALSMLPESAPIRGYVVGGAIYHTRGSQHTLEELRAVARRLGIEGRVGFTGFVNDSAAAMRALDVVVHASVLPEPFGLVIAEAMACAKPVIAASAGGAAEIIAENHNTLTHRAGDAAAMAACIARLADDSRLREKLGRDARRWAQQRFDRSRLANEIIPLYESLAN